MIGAWLNLLLLFMPTAMAQQPSSPAANSRSPFVSVPPPPSTSQQLEFGPPLPEFEAKDINGRTWRNVDLRGKFTLIYIWYTFEARGLDKLAPSAHRIFRDMANLYEVQRFYDEVKDKKNIQVLTFCRDYDYTHAPEYMKEKKYTFPVIANWVLLRKLFGTDFPERQRIIDPNGRMSSPLGTWPLGEVLFELEKVAANGAR